MFELCTKSNFKSDSSLILYRFYTNLLLSLRLVIIQKEHYMAIFRDGAWHGVTGGVSMYNRKGKSVSRTLPKEAKKISPAMAVAQQHFAYVLNLVRKMKDAIDLGFKDFDPMRVPYNVAISLNLNKYKLARQQEKTNNLAWFEISKGDLSNARTVSAVIDPDGFIDISWEGIEDWKVQHDNDYLIAVVYNKTKDTSNIHLTSVARKDLSAKIPWNDFKGGDMLELFIFFHVHQFKYENGGKANVSDSKWVGEFLI